jgi:cytochrome d ubiquinol oxidase subunit II
MIDLNTLWFLLIGVLFSGFFVLEGFDYGVGMLLPFFGKDDTERRMIINSIGPVWDGNEVWLLTAGGAIFAAFPHWYASMFSALYLALVFFLVGLIIRGVGLEFRSKLISEQWRGTWDRLIAVGSFIPALLIGVVFANLSRGLPFDSRMIYQGGFFDLLSPFALLGGLCTLSLFLVQGALFLSLKTSGDVQKRAEKFALWVRYAAFILLIIYFIAFPVASENAALSQALRVVTLVLYALPSWFMRKGKMGWSFAFSSLTLVAFVATTFQGMFPNVLISTLGSNNNIDIYRAASSPYTLGIMSWVALIFVPIVLVYTAWTYWVFRKRLTRSSTFTY